MPGTNSKSGGSSSGVGAKWVVPSDEDQMEKESLLPSGEVTTTGIGGFRQKSKSTSSSQSRRSAMLQRMSPLPRTRNWFSKATSKGASGALSSSQAAPALVPPTLITSSADGEDDEDHDESTSDSNHPSRKSTVQLCPHGYANIDEDTVSIRSTLKSPTASQRVVYSHETRPRRRSLAREALHAIYFLNTDSPPRTMSTDFSAFNHQNGTTPRVLSSFGSSLGTNYGCEDMACHHHSHHNTHSSARDANCNNCKDTVAMNTLSSPNSDMRTKASSDSTHNSYVVEEIDGVDHVTLKIHSPLKNNNEQVGKDYSSCWALKLVHICFIGYFIPLSLRLATQSFPTCLKT